MINPKHMSAADIIEKCDPRDVVELVDMLVGNFLDRDKLLARILEIRKRANQNSGQGFIDANGAEWT